MLTKTKSLVARTALAVVALAGVFAAVPASARPFDGEGRGHDRVTVERDYRPVEYGYGRDWRHGPVFEGRMHYGHRHHVERGRW